MAIAESRAEYRDIPGWPGYRAGSDGTIWSSRLRGAGGRAFDSRGPWRLMPLTRNRLGYLTVRLFPGRKYWTAHRLVLLAFVGPCPPGMECCHWDGDRANNVLANLRWDTRAGNRKDNIRHGTHPAGERNGRAKLTAELALAIRAEYDAAKIGHRKLPNGVAAAIAAKHGISKTTLHDLLSQRRGRWACAVA